MQMVVNPIVKLSEEAWSIDSASWAATFPRLVGGGGKHGGCRLAAPGGAIAQSCTLQTRAALAARPIVGLGMLLRQGDEMWYRVGADLVVIVHLLFIGFVVGGVFLT
jgi:hypothetical protein